MTRYDVLRRRIRERDYRVAVVGLGYVGLPLSLLFHQAGFFVTALDIDPEKIALLNQGRSYLRHVDVQPLGQDPQRFVASSDYRELARADAILLCVPTPLAEHREPDLQYVRGTVQAVQKHLRPGQLIVLESTTYPGTTDEVVRPLLEQSGLLCGEDFYLAYSPEREDPGNSSFTTQAIPKLLGGVNEASGDLAEALYSEVVERVIRVRDARVAEAAKLTENVFRAVNIALVNELKVTFERMGLDVWEILRAAETKPFGFMRFDPGPGFGGHCIPVDPFYLSWKAREFGAPPQFIELAGEINTHMHEYVVGRLVDALNQHGKAVSGSHILVLGIAYKRDLGDCRESPAFPIMARLEALGARVDYHDPFVREIPKLRRWPQWLGKRSETWNQGLLRAVDAVLLVTDHSNVDYEELRRSARLIIDTRGVLPNASHVVRA